MQLHTLIPIVVVCLFLYRIFLRVRRNIGWQPLKPGRMKFLIALSLIIGLLFLFLGALHPVSLISDIAGILLGVVLAVYGAGMTRFEQRGQQLFYRPNTWIGSLVSVLFLGRLAYRFYEMYTIGIHAEPTANPWASMGYDANAPWSSGLMLIMFAYFFTYSILLLRKRASQATL